MCMMKQNGETESCEVAKSLAALGVRVTKVEGRLDKMEGSIAVGFTQVNTAISNLANQFGERMNTLDRRIVEEKAKENERKYAEQVKWGEVKRNIATWAARLILLGCASAMGMTAYKMIFGT